MKLENKKISLQQRKLIIFNLLGFLTIFVLLGLMAVVMINASFFKEVQKELEESQQKIYSNVWEIQIRNTVQVRINAEISSRVYMVFYDSNNEIYAYDNSLLPYIDEKLPNDPGQWVEDEEYLNMVELALNHEILSLNDFGSFYNEELESGLHKYYFETLSFAVNSPLAPNIKSCKLFTLVNGEVASRNEIVRIYVICASLMFIFGVAASILLSYLSIKPIKSSLEKQLLFVSDASHELRTPLAIVQSKLDNVLTKSDETVFNVSSDIAISLKEISRLSKLTTDLLMLAQNDNESYHLTYEEFNIKLLIDDVSMPFSEIAQIQNKKFIRELKNIIVKADKSKVTQMLIIILDNALKYTSENETIKISVDENGNDLLITVADSGIGMSDDVMKHIFERFFRADKARSRETGGNGLGLSIAQTIAFQHKGEITVRHNEPKGTIFTIRLPKN